MENENDYRDVISWTLSILAIVIAIIALLH